MSNDNGMAFNRDFKQRPEQFLHRLNTKVADDKAKSNSLPVWSQDKKKVIITGSQPDGSWGIREYSVNGDVLVQTAVIL